MNLRKFNIQAAGYDSTSFTKNSESLIKIVDLSQPIELGREFDLVISINVGEHIFSDFEDNFISNLAKHSKKFIYLSWGILG